MMSAGSKATTSERPTFVTGQGQSDTHAKEIQCRKSGDMKPNPHPKAGQPYNVITGKEIAAMAKNPTAMPKEKSPWVIASSYAEHDARKHDVQREFGVYRMLSGDIDTGNKNLDEVSAAIMECVGEDAAHIIYSTSSASTQNRKWRFLVFLADELPGHDYKDTQHALFSMMRLRGVVCDVALARPGQLVFLPNVPPERRNEAGEPLFYEYRLVTGRTVPLTEKTPVIRRREAIRKDVEDAASEAAKRRRGNVGAGDWSGEDTTPIDAFNADHTIDEMLEKYGYKRDGNSNHWQSPNQSSGSYATVVFDGNVWVSLSESDMAAGIGLQRDVCCCGNAFDLYKHYEHDGSTFKAVKAYGQIMRDRDNVYKFSDFSDFSKGDDPEPEGASESETEPEPEPDKSDDGWPTLFEDFDAEGIEPRQWVYGNHYLRSFVSVLASAGGIGKTSLQIVEALAICTGKPLLGEMVKEQCNVWIINLEDPIDEMKRRVLAAMKFYGIKPEEVQGKLFIDAGRDFDLTFSIQSSSGIKQNFALVEMLKKKIPERNIGCTFIDPFVGTHQINENDNMAINSVVAQIREIADETKCAIGLVHHIRKGNGQDADIDSVRGAGSLIGAARAARVINRISEENAIEMGVSQDQALGIFRVDDGKANLAPPAANAVFRRMQGVQIANGEWIGVATPFDLPDEWDGMTTEVVNDILRQISAGVAGTDGERFSIRAQDANRWVGKVIMDYPFRKAEDFKSKGQAKMILRSWMKSGLIFIDTYYSAAQRKDRQGVFVSDSVGEKS